MASRRIQSAAASAPAQVGHFHTHPAGICSGASSLLSVAVTYSPAYDPEGSTKDFKFILMEKESAPDKKEAEKLVMNIDSGKQFICSTSADAAGECKYHAHVGIHPRILSLTLYWLDFMSHQPLTPTTRWGKRNTNYQPVLLRAQLQENVGSLHIKMHTLYRFTKNIIAVSFPCSSYKSWKQQQNHLCRWTPLSLF